MMRRDLVSSKIEKLVAPLAFPVLFRARDIGRGTGYLRRKLPWRPQPAPTSRCQDRIPHFGAVAAPSPPPSSRTRGSIRLHRSGLQSRIDEHATEKFRFFRPAGRRRRASHHPRDQHVRQETAPPLCAPSLPRRQPVHVLPAQSPPSPSLHQPDRRQRLLRQIPATHTTTAPPCPLLKYYAIGRRWISGGAHFGPEASSNAHNTGKGSANTHAGIGGTPVPILPRNVCLRRPHW